MPARITGGSASGNSTCTSRCRPGHAHACRAASRTVGWRPVSPVSAFSKIGRKPVEEERDEGSARRRSPRPARRAPARAMGGKVWPIFAIERDSGRNSRAEGARHPRSRGRPRRASPPVVAAATRPRWLAAEDASMSDWVLGSPERRDPSSGRETRPRNTSGATQEGEEHDEHDSPGRRAPALMPASPHGARGWPSVNAPTTSSSCATGAASRPDQSSSA